MRKTAWVLLSFLPWIFFACPCFAASYTLDTDHSSMGFKVRHLFSKVEGHFREFQGTFEYEPGKPETWKANVTVNPATIDTNVAARDKHLRSADFFDVQKFPTMRFVSTGVLEASASSAKLEGILTMHGVEKPIVFDVTINGEGADPWGNIRSSFSAKAAINRKDFGLTWNQALETGQLLVGEEVEINVEIEGLKQ